MAKRVLSIILLAVLFAPIVAVAESGCPRGHMCWKGMRGQHGGGTNRWNGGGHYDNSYYERTYRRREVLPPGVVTVRKPGIVDYVVVKPLNTIFGLLFGETELVDTNCADDDVACHRAEGREKGRYAGKSAVADATEDETYREAYDEAIRNSGRTTAPTEGQLREEDTPVEADE